MGEEPLFFVDHSPEICYNVAIRDEGGAYETGT